MLGLLFLLSFVLYLVNSASAANEEALSLQNWQSEFLSTLVLVILSIFLRFRGSPESKPMAASYSTTG